MSNDLPKLHNKANNALVARLFSEVPGLCGSAGDISQAKQSAAGGDAVRPDPAQGCVNEGSDIGGCESAGVKV